MKRNHPLSIFYASLSFSSLVSFGFSVYTLNELLSRILDALDLTVLVLSILLSLLLVVVFFLFRTWVWYRTSYSYDEDSLDLIRVTKLRVKKIALKSEKVASITRQQTLFLRIFGIYKVSVTTDTSAGDETDSIDLFLSAEEAHALVENFEHPSSHSQTKETEAEEFLAEGQDAEATIYRHSWLEMLIYPIICNSRMTYILFVGYTAVLFFFNDESYEALWISILLLLVSMLTPFAKSFLEGANLTLTFRESSDHLDLESGLIARERNRFSKSNIRIFEYRYSRLTRLAQAKVAVVGTLNKKEEGNDYQALTLYVKKEKVENLQAVCGFELGDINYLRPHLISFIYGLIGKSLLASVIIAGMLFARTIVEKQNLPAFIYPMTLTFIVFYTIFSILMGYFDYKSTKYLGINEKFIVISKGFLNQKIDIFKFDNIQSIREVRGPIARRIGTSKLAMDLFDVGKLESHLMANYTSDDVESVKEIIKKKIGAEQ